MCKDLKLMTDCGGILLVEDDPDHAELVKRCLESVEGLRFELIHCRDAQQAREDLKRSDISLVFLDYQLGLDTGLDLLREMRTGGDLRPVIILTGQGNEYIAVETVRAGADDYLVKSDLATEAIKTVIGKALARRDAVQRGNAERIKIRENLSRLTRREREVLEFIVDGKTSREIGQCLHRSEHTIKIHRSRIMRKMGARTPADLVRSVLSVVPHDGAFRRVK